MWYLFFLWTFLPIQGGELPDQEGYFDYQGEVPRAYRAISHLRLAEARELCDQISDRQPDNLATLHLTNYIDFLEVYISEDRETYRRWKKEIPGRLRAIRRGPSGSPYYLYVQAEIRLHWALARLKFGEYLGAFNEISIAYQLLRKNSKRFPSFIPNQKDLGLLHALVGAVPDQYRWAIELVSGMRGSLSQGGEELERAASSPGLFRQEALLFRAYYLLYLSDRPEQAWEILQGADLSPDASPLHCFFLAQVAMQTSRNDLALEYLTGRPRGPDYFPFPYLHFLQGLTLLRQLDPASETHFKAFLREFAGRHYRKEAYQKLAWLALIRGHRQGYRSFMEQCAREGYSVVGEDQAAAEEADSGEEPHAGLLRARLLCDGGYYGRALAELAELDPRAFTQDRHRIEFHYRKGRCLQGQGKDRAALVELGESVRLGASGPWYFACKAALESGLIYERSGRSEKAAESYRRCLSLSPKSYRQRLHEQARIGLNRLETEK